MSYLAFEAATADGSVFGFREVFGFAGIAQTIAKLGQIVTNLPNKNVEEIAQNLRDAYEMNFEAERRGGETSGAKWRVLSMRTRRERLEQGFSPEHPILVRTGAYKASWVQKGAPHHVERIKRSGGDLTLEVGSSHPYTAVHEEGTDPRVPIRSVVGHPNPNFLRLAVWEAVSKEYEKLIGGSGSAAWLGGAGTGYVNLTQWQFGVLNFHTLQYPTAAFVTQRMGRQWGGLTFGVRQTF